jgi:hypothetical protein F3_03205
MEYKRLSDCAFWGKDRTDNINYESYISTENMIKDKGGVTIASSLPDSKTASAYRPNDILLSNIRPYFRKIWCADKNGSCSNDVLVVRANEDIDSKFLYYVLSDNNFFNYDTVTSKGTKMPRGTQTAIMKYLVPDINIGKQRKIANILSTYDNLIENNNKRIKLLEQMTESLYKEWFVRFRFPEYKDVEFESEIPKGWKICRIDQLSKIKAGGDAPDDSTKEITDECFIPIYSNGIENEGLYGYTSKAKINKPSITISARGTVGYTCLRRVAYTPIVRLICIIPHEEKLANWLFYYFKRTIVIANGTSQQQITIPIMSREKVLLPTKDLIQKFHKYSSCYLDEIDSLKAQNSNLKKQRDMLLPRLMSGKLEV